MWGAFGAAPTSCAVTFVSQRSLDRGLAARIDTRRAFVPVANTRAIGKADMVHNSATPHIEVDPKTYAVRADGELMTCEPATVLPLAQRYTLF
jgi:urease subunit alpha